MTSNAPRRASRPEAPAFTRRERHLHPTARAPRAAKPPRSRGGSVTFTLRPAPPRRKPPRSRGGSVTFTLRPASPRAGSPRVHAAGASPSPYGPRPRAPEAPAFTRRERHLHPTARAARAAKPPRSRGGSVTFTLRPAPPRAGSPRVHAAGASPSPYGPCRARRSPRVHAAGASPSPYGPRRRALEAPAFTRRERHLHPTARAAARLEAPAFTRRESHLCPSEPDTGTEPAAQGVLDLRRRPSYNR